MTRQFLFVTTIALVAAGHAFAAETRQNASDDKPSRPNVLFIAIDDQNDWIGALGGHPLAKTPHIDRLAREGTDFHRFNVLNPVCSPSRAAATTGTFPSRFGIH